LGLATSLEVCPLWLIPPALCMLAAGYINRARLTPEQLTALRYASAIMIYVSSTVEIFINGVAEAPWLPAVLAGLSIIGVLAGILLRVQSFLYLGMGFLVVAILTIIWHAAEGHTCRHFNRHVDAARLSAIGNNHLFDRDDHLWVTDDNPRTEDPAAIIRRGRGRTITGMSRGRRPRPHGDPPKGAPRALGKQRAEHRKGPPDRQHIRGPPSTDGLSRSGERW